MITPHLLKTQFSGLIRQGWNEIPEVMLSTIASMCFMVYGTVKVLNRDEGADNHRYKMTYIVIRPDDPRVKDVHKD